ncbi:MAG: acetyl-CoA hydrolase/transferase family protein [Tepidiformaceae bacterium]
MRRHEHDYVPIPFALRFKAESDNNRTLPERRRADVVLVQVSLPDEHGFVSFGANAWNQLRFVELATFTLGEMSPNVMPSFGEGNVAHVSAFHSLVLNDSARRMTTVVAPNEAQRAIAGYLSEVVCDGDTIQVGAGNVPTACVYAGAFDKKADLGWHSEASVGGIIDLIRTGVINGARKTIDRGLAVATGYAGNAEQMKFARLHPRIHTRPTEYVHNLRVISAQENMLAINAALCIDLTGQIAADSVGQEMIGGTGGQLEFAIGALNARNGRSVTVLESRALGGRESTIVDLLPKGTVVTVPRQFADIVITEHGIARLWAKSVRERAQEFISVAHPDFRPELRRRAQELLG